ncbi:uncharacterized protein B0T15DRAFT_496986 [Chaetomium strumarium]|uniref:Homeobox domain-containing protein n=1 Tax=Chaetomium strumarium TaxID=1170767 RepID=A0AAJ0GM69_9PEZI|nr:hypothetical protein B0T15DRAFT_496986 [Chaetomium strumarium]
MEPLRDSRRANLPPLRELLSRLDQIDPRPQETGPRGYPPTGPDTANGSSPATPQGHYTLSPPQPHELNRPKWFQTQEERESRDHWRHLPGRYPTPPRDAPPPALSSSAPPPRPPVDRWMSSPYSQGHPDIQRGPDIPTDHSHSRFGSFHEGHGPGGYRNEEYCDRRYDQGGAYVHGHYDGVRGGSQIYDGRGYDPRPSGPGSAGSHQPDSPAIPAHQARGKRNRPNLPKEAVDIMMAWVDDHIENPYEREDRPELIRRTGLEERRVIHWFTNFRRRKWHKHRVDFYSREVSKAKAARHAAEEEAARNPPCSAAAEAARRAADAAARRAAEAEAARSAAEKNYLRAKERWESWEDDQKRKRGAEREVKRKAGLLVDDDSEDDLD